MLLSVRETGLVGMLFVLVLVCALSGCDEQGKNDPSQVVTTTSPLCVDASARSDLHSLVETLNKKAGIQMYVYTSVWTKTMNLGCAENRFSGDIPVTRHILWHKIDHDPVADRLEAEALRAPTRDPDAR